MEVEMVLAQMRKQNKHSASSAKMQHSQVNFQLEKQIK